MRTSVAARRMIVAGMLGVTVAGCGQWLKSEQGAGKPVVTPVPGTRAIYDVDPNHLWNRLYAALCVRQVEGQDLGVDRLDPLLWANTQRLFTGPAHETAIRVLEEFRAGHGETLIQDPVKRAMMQRDLWAVLDWAGIAAQRHGSDDAQAGALELRRGLVAALLAMRLTAGEIGALPDNYAAAARSGTYAADYDKEHAERYFLPPDLMDPKGPWVCVANQPYRIMATAHAADFGYRSVFTVFLRVPGGRKAALDYLTAFRGAMPEVSQQAMSRPFERLAVGAEPKLPVGSAVALVRQAVLLNENGEMVPTHLTESVQFRVNRERRAEDNPNILPQDVYELELRRAKLFAGDAGGLHARTADEKDILFVQFQGKGIDWLEYVQSRPEERDSAPVGGETVMQSCNSCHGPEGQFSLRSLFKGAAGRNLSLEEIRLGPEREASDMEQQAFATVNAKKKEYSWGFLEGMDAAGRR